MNLSLSKKMQWIGLTVMVAAAVFFTANSSARAKAPLSIGTNPQGSVAYAVGAAVANISSEKAGFQMRVVPQGGPPVTIPMVNKGRLDFSVAIGLVAASAHDGVLMFKDRPQEKIRLLCYLFPLYQSFIVRQDSDIQSIADLKGKRIPSRFTKQKNTGILAEGVMATAGLTWDDVKGVPVPNGARGIDDFAAGKTDAGFFSLASGKVLQANAAVNGIRVLSIPDTPEAETVLKRKAPGSFITLLKPGTTKIPGIKTPTRVSSQPFVITVSADVSEETVYAIVKAMYGSKDKMAAMHKTFNAFDPKGMCLDIGVPYHPGAVKFYKEVGLL